MSVDILQDKIRKTKNPSMLELAMPISDIPPQFSQDAAGYGTFCREILSGLKGVIPAVRVSFSMFALLGCEGLLELEKTVKLAGELGYYVAMDAPEIASPMMAKQIADSLLGESSCYPCDGLILNAYAGSDILKPFLPYCKKEKKDVFSVVRNANKSAPELQDLLCGGRLVHAAAADHVNRYGVDTAGKTGYTRVGVLAAASSAESLRSIRTKYPKLFLLVDGLDYPNANAKNGAVVCGGTSITCAWKQAESDGSDWLAHSKAAAERMKKNLTRYVTVL